MAHQLHKIVWSEGMYLAPHHFQAQSRFFEDAIGFVADCLSQFNYGYLGLEIDEGQLRRGTFVLHQARGVMPDGLVFELSQDDLSARESIAEIFPPSAQPVMLSLAIPAYQEGRQNVAENHGSGSMRFGTHSVEVKDFNSGQDLIPVPLLRHNFRIATDSEITPGDVSLPLARILRDSKGQFILDPTYVPPVLRVAVSPRLQFLLERLLEILSDKSRSLVTRRKDAMTSEVRADPRELVEFWLLYSVNSAIPILRQWKGGRSPHPGQLYLTLSQLAGALCTFGSQSEPAALPAYDHRALGDCFTALDDHIRQHLELGLPVNCISIPLEKFDNFLFGGAIADPRCFGKSRWVLAVKAAVPETTLISRGPSLVKVSARDWIERVVRQAVPGAPLAYLPAPPASVPVHFGVVYFSIDQNHRLFEPIRTMRNIGIFVPGELVGAEVELYVVLGDTHS